MRCGKAKRLLALDLDSELAASDGALLRAHVEQCAACQAHRDALSSALETLDALPQLEPSSGFDAELQRKLDAAPEPAPARPLRAWIPAIGTLAAAAAAITVVVWLGRRSPTRPVAPPPALAAKLDLLQSYDTVRALDGLDDVDAIVNLDKLLAEVGGDR